MKIYSGMIELDYDPATDILTTSMPDLREFSLPEVKMCLEIVVSNIRNYDIKKLLLDSSGSVVEIDDEAYKAVVAKFTMDLMATRLKKLARVATTSPAREQKSTKLANEIRQEFRTTVEFANFPSKPEALKWLLED